MSPSVNYPDRSAFSAKDTVEYIWNGLGLPKESLQSLRLSGDELCLPSSFKIADLAQASIGISALLAAQIHALRNVSPTPVVTVPRRHAVIEYKSERLYTLNGQPPLSTWGPLSGLYKSLDGYVRVHDSFSNHHYGVKALLGCAPDADRPDVESKVATWRSEDLESAAFDANIVISALRNYKEWDVHPQASAISNFPILLRKIGDAPVGLPQEMRTENADKSLRGLRVIEFSRVIAAPLSGRTLAAHGADVLWVTSPNLPDLPVLDRDTGRGKRTIQIDLKTEDGSKELSQLLEGAHVVIQGYRPGSLASRGLSPDALAQRFSHRGIICANLSAYGPAGPWADKRGFDSLVQTCSGMNISEAEHFGAGEPARPMPCQALDHTAGYFLASGIEAALYKQATEGGSWQVDVSLAGVMKYLRSLGQFEGRNDFHAQDYKCAADVPEEYLETKPTAFGEMTAVRHSASIQGVEIGWDFMPKPLGSDHKKWL
ncbi:CoA-transferase family III domain-containing protein [Aspergillus avenaceus]|uniref:CoA-transferase family III domain-containing protein n=1 Tax=Aspergillus avenaceus TaxID=36643 RepID=A0A5N6U785_ASPAV|nr:CoA-transferase family III domain-containing protein [Aspergillus avenaceus]